MKPMIKEHFLSSQFSPFMPYTRARADLRGCEKTSHAIESLAQQKQMGFPF